MKDTATLQNELPALVDTYAQFPMTIEEGAGARVRDSEGRWYWDFYGGHAVALLGHAHPAVADAIDRQARRLLFYSNVVPLRVRTLAAERLAGFAPPGLNHVFFCNSGTEANENALKVAIQLTGRPCIAALSGAFHGRTLLALAGTDNAKLHAPVKDMLCTTVRLRPNHVEDASLVDSGTAAVILEPIQSMAGVVTLDEPFLTALRRRCDETGALLIYDEVQTGMGRLGRPFAAGEAGVTPDMLTLAKGIANGVPMGAVVMTAHVARNLGVGDLGTTFGGGPLACAAMLATIDTIERAELVAHAARLGTLIHNRMRVGPVEEVLGRGCLIGLRTRVPCKVVQEALRSRGFITGTSGDPFVLRLLPPINLPTEAVDELATALAELGDLSA